MAVRLGAQADYPTTRTTGTPLNGTDISGAQFRMRSAGNPNWSPFPLVAFPDKHVEIEIAEVGVFIFAVACVLKNGKISDYVETSYEIKDDSPASVMLNLSVAPV